jgi:hypothetical protein
LLEAKGAIERLPGERLRLLQKQWIWTLLKRSVNNKKGANTPMTNKIGLNYPSF